ncbi:asparagine--tRNA ligase [Christensenella sp. MSJ-20]|uniref:asparagine--tRNA ligase n=1 Tax=Christensenella sp. MSJ-20 TaxID=2841518 RepID=UPI001C758493|nr:asparagine--tRNA ligase [Christensenella sp. MSJ-20]
MAQKIMPLLRHPDAYMEKEVTLMGRVRSVRDMKSVVFLNLWDGSCLGDIQVVGAEEIGRQMSRCSTGDVVEATGRVVASAGGKQAVELSCQRFAVLSKCPSDYPLQKKRHSLEYLRTIGHLRPRTNTYYAAFKVRSLLCHAIHQFFREEGFVYVHTPLITGSDCEGAGEMFQVTTLDLENPPRTEDGQVDYSQDFFGKKTHLTVSGQLNVEAFALAYGDCYTFGPTFRAENSNTARHAAEFWMVEPEMAFCDLMGNMDNAQRMIKSCANYVLENGAEEMEFFDRFIAKGVIDRLDAVRTADFGHVTYTEAINLLQKADEKFNYPVSWGIDLQTEHERYLCEKVFHRPVFVTDYPKEIKAFYMRMNEDGKTVAAMDLLVPGVGEMIGGSQREERYDVLLDKMKEAGLDVDAYGWYLDLRKYGAVVHSGYGLGLERAVMYMTGIANIRDVLPYPRTPKNADF